MNILLFKISEPKKAWSIIDCIFKTREHLKIFNCIPLRTIAEPQKFFLSKQDSPMFQTLYYINWIRYLPIWKCWVSNNKVFGPRFLASIFLHHPNVKPKLNNIAFAQTASDNSQSCELIPIWQEVNLSRSRRRRE